MTDVGDWRPAPASGAQVFAVGGWDGQMDALRPRLDAVNGGSRSALKRGLGGAAEARRSAGVLNPSGSSHGRGHEATELRDSQSGQVSVPGLWRHSASPVSIPLPEAGRWRARLNHWTGSRCGERLSLSGAVPQESKALIPRRGSGSETNPPAFSGRRTGKSRKPHSVVRPGD